VLCEPLTSGNFIATVDVAGNVNKYIGKTEKREMRLDKQKNTLNVLEQAKKNAQLQENKEKKELASKERFYEMYRKKFHSNSTLISNA
jgi:hypothetical protein